MPQKPNPDTGNQFEELHNNIEEVRKYLEANLEEVGMGTNLAVSSHRSSG